MKRKLRRETESFSVSFLDVASCGFGAMIILLMVVNPSVPTSLEPADIPVNLTVPELQQELFAVRGETAVLERELTAKQEQLSALKERVARLQRDLESAEAEHLAAVQATGEISAEVDMLTIARQTLTDEMRRLLEGTSASARSAIAGVPVDSEYIVFVIDTSGSMHSYSWNKMLEVIEDTLDVYPEVRGIQIMNDMGEYMFSSYRRQWIPDTPARRSQLLASLRTWTPFSNSSPVEGVIRAVNDLYSPDRQISIYVLGDDFQPGSSIREVLRAISRINVEHANGERLVRIHGIGFPALLSAPAQGRRSVNRFATLMREMTRQNGGTFVGLNEAH